MAQRRPSRGSGLTHLDARRRPTMVDVGGKSATHRVAEAEAIVRLPPAVARALRASGHRTRKGPVFDTAIIAGVMAVKRTAEFIPFCHPLPVEHCAIDIEARTGGTLRIRCRVETHHKTGVEMEALAAVSVALLTVYDMAKAVERGMEITGVGLVEKRGGTGGDWRRAEAPTG